MTEDCICKAENTIILPCSGGSNFGQIANQVALSLDILGLGRLYCLAGIGGHIAGMVESAKSAERIVAIDGCDTACARKTIEHAGLNGKENLITHSCLKQLLPALQGNYFILISV
jgi:uncharacterized metal-binding protein